MSTALFSPLQLGTLELPNRIVVSPMCQYSASDGNAGAWHRMHLGSLATSGAALLLIEATAVEARGRITPGCLGLYSDDNARALAGVLHDVRSYSSVPIGIQLAHAGRKASSARPWDGGQQLAAAAGGWQTVAPSAVAHGTGELAPTALDADGLRQVRDAFVAAAVRAARIGIDAVEVHAAHGYLLHEFLSPLANRRNDDYGGSLENRLRFPLEVFDAVRAVWPSGRPIGVRVSASDWVDGGWDLEQTIAFATALRARGCDWLDVSSGGISPQQKIQPGPGYQIPFARAIRAATGITTIGVGLITDPAQAERIIADGDADLVALARALLWEPHWPWHAAAALGAQVEVPAQYWRSEPHGSAKVFKGARQGQR
ncbi:MAG: NADH:flavin oxidoreductase/NADH oxidase [Pseudomonadota bacterium]|nr:NADH:flavin oxidoreductase/NADH oxidase [Pseudomonadota bacterium]